MTKISDIRVFDEADLRYDVSELDIDVKNGHLWIYIKAPEVCLKELIETWPDHEQIEKSIKNVLEVDGIQCRGVRYFPGTNVIYLKLDQSVATIRIADLLHIPERAITPYWHGYAIINTEMI